MSLRESKWFPRPNTLSLSNPDAFKATYVIMSTGLVTTNITESGANLAIAFEYSATILAFGTATSILDIPELLGLPALKTTISEFLTSSKS